MKTIENGIHYYPRESDAKEGFLARPPAGVIKGQWLIIHGVGERGAADLEALKNVALGWDYDGTGPMERQYGLLTPELIAQADKHGTLLVIVNYPTNFDPSDIDFVMNTIESDPAFKVDKTRWGIIGFSWGGREVMRCLTSTAQKAARFAVAVVCAPVNPGGNLQYIVDAKLQLIGTTYSIDPRVSSSNVQAIITGINKLGPVIKPVYIEWPINYPGAHGTFNEMLNGTDKLIPQSIYDYMDSVSTLERKQYPSSIIVEPPIVQPPPTAATAVASYTGAGPSIRLIGDKSTGWKTGYEGTWSFVSGPAGVTSKQVFPGGSNFINASATLPVQGTYVFRLNLTGATPVDVTVVYGAATEPPPVLKEVLSFDSTTDLITYADKTTEIGRSLYEGGKWKIISASGTTYNL